MSDHAVIVPTRFGPAAAVVTEPTGKRRGALVFLHGVGPPARAGVNRVWTRVAHDLAGLGLVVLRFDYATEGDSTLAGCDVPQHRGWRRIDLAMLREIAPWFLRRTGERRLLLAGGCHGGRVALEFAASDPVAGGLFLLVPFLSQIEPRFRRADGNDIPPVLDGRVWSGGPTLDCDADLVAGFRVCMARGPVWVLVGGGEEAEAVRPFAGALEKAGSSFELEVVPNMSLHPFGHPEQQSTLRRRLRERVDRALAERRRLAPASP
jgi:dienelactone hydrolase